MDWSGLGQLMQPGAGASPALGMSNLGGNGGILAKILNQTSAAPAVPADGSMQATIGPGAAPPAAVTPYKPTLGLPKGGLLGIMQGGQMGGIGGLLQHLLANPQGIAPNPLTAAPQSGMIPTAPAALPENMPQLSDQI